MVLPREYDAVTEHATRAARLTASCGGGKVEKLDTMNKKLLAALEGRVAKLEERGATIETAAAETKLLKPAGGDDAGSDGDVTIEKSGASLALSAPSGAVRFTADGCPSIDLCLTMFKLDQLVAALGGES